MNRTVSAREKSAPTQTAPDPLAARRAKLKLLAGFAFAAWGRAVVVIVGATAAAHLVGLDETAGFAVIPGVYMALGPPAGRVDHSPIEARPPGQLRACNTLQRGRQP